jgi:hypothetical protein
MNFACVTHYENIYVEADYPAHVDPESTSFNKSAALPHIVELATALVGGVLRGGAGKRSQWDRKEKEYALGGKPQTET